MDKFLSRRIHGAWRSIVSTRGEGKYSKEETIQVLRWAVDIGKISMVEEPTLRFDGWRQASSQRIVEVGNVFTIVGVGLVG